MQDVKIFSWDTYSFEQEPDGIPVQEVKSSFKGYIDGTAESPVSAAQSVVECPGVKPACGGAS